MLSFFEDLTNCFFEGIREKCSFLVITFYNSFTDKQPKNIKNMTRVINFERLLEN